MKLALLCGGPSLERGISLNSARSVCDHLSSDQMEVLPLYFDEQKKPYLISRAQLYSNTPSDFDFKLKQKAKALNKSALTKFLKSVDLTFIAMHGAFGEDGEIQRLLTRLKIPFVGSPEEACKKAFDKHEANALIAQNGFFTFPSTVLKAHVPEDHLKLLKKFFKVHQLKRAIVKPATGGSSIAVYSVSTPGEALEKAREIFAKRVDTRVVVEPFCEGREFTVILLQNRFGLPVAILPTEMELSYEDHQVFDYRKKYLATRQVTYHCPPRFSDERIAQIQGQAEQIFMLFGMQDFARFDGWLLPDGKLWFSDLNPISGMEQNSFLFMQAARVGMSHGEVLRYILASACRRHSIAFPDGGPKDGSNSPSACPEQNGVESNGRRGGSMEHRTGLGSGSKSAKISPLTAYSLQLTAKKPIHVLFGGKTAERQVSLMSGTNVWLKLRPSQKYEPHPYLLDSKHRVWKLPYALALNHTVEEIEENCEQAKKNEARLHRLIQPVKDKLAPQVGQLREPWFLPEKMTLAQFIRKSNYVFIGLHGGIGEDGTLQTLLEKAKVPFNGSDSQGSKVGMDKYRTGQLLNALKKEGIYSAAKHREALKIFPSFTSSDYRSYWKALRRDLGGHTLIVKPLGEGCSAGVARLFGPEDLQAYVKHALNKAEFIPTGTLKNQHGLIEMPPQGLRTLLFEPFVLTDKVRIIGNQIRWEAKTNWIEITMRLLGKKGALKAMPPSVTVTRGNVLSLEEKFQGGTGVNLTPPPAPYVKPKAVKKAMEGMEKVAQALGLGGYCRIDAFMHTQTGELMVIEANTTPGLTPSTVIYHQALAQNPPLYPQAFLEKVLEIR